MNKLGNLRDHLEIHLPKKRDHLMVYGITGEGVGFAVPNHTVDRKGQHRWDRLEPEDLPRLAAVKPHHSDFPDDHHEYWAAIVLWKAACNYLANQKGEIQGYLT